MKDYGTNIQNLVLNKKNKVMECKTCKQKNQKSNNKGETINMNIIPEEIQNGNYNGSLFFKLIAFLAIIIVLPFIILGLVGQIFLTFFMPKSLPKVTKKIKNFFIGILNMYAKFVYNKKIKKRENQFGKTDSYEEKPKNETEFDNIEIFDGKENKK